MFVAAHLIDQIDEAGYLTALAARCRQPARRAAGAGRGRCSATIQTFDPTGVGARDLAECLALQAKEADRYDPCMARLIDNLDLLARGELARLKRICDVDDEDMADMIRELRNYDPKPGCRFGGETMQAVVPDMFIARRKDGWAIEINAATLPRVLVNRVLLCRAVVGTAGQGVEGVAHRHARQRQLAGQGARPAPAHDRQGRDARS